MTHAVSTFMVLVGVLVGMALVMTIAQIDVRTKEGRAIAWTMNCVCVIALLVLIAV